MKISNDQVKKALLSYVQKVEGKKTGRVTSQGDKPEAVAPKGDSVILTAHGAEVAKAKELYNVLPDTREGVVQELKVKVESGTYKPATKDIADKIIYRTIIDKMG
ncbi:MAG TPA: flagellar biosynthesis anti-sigma factor FlgM [Candidatus Aquicultor sp.]